jgi:hypothetical protein
MICNYYKKFPNIAGPSSFISGNKSYRIDGIRSHFSENFAKVTCAILAPNSGTESEILRRHLREYDKF